MAIDWRSDDHLEMLEDEEELGQFVKGFVIIAEWCAVSVDSQQGGYTAPWMVDTFSSDRSPV
jgi:hypothetical protein